MKCSYYNILAPLDDGRCLIYNTLHESLAVLSESEKREYELIGQSIVEDGALFDELAAARFLVDDPEKEAGWIQYEYEKYKFNNRLFELIITPTIDCNFRCAYCYEKKRPGSMSEHVRERLVRFVEDSYQAQPFKEFRVTWYGGEPLLEPDIIEQLSTRFLAFCNEKGVGYHAAIMTNGSLADEATMRRMYACGVRSVQVTFGGKGAVHDRERPSVDGLPSYETVRENVERMLDDGVAAVHVEYVFDADNLESCLEVVRELGFRETLYTHFPYPKMDYNNEFRDKNGNELFHLQTPKDRALGYRDIILATKPDVSHWRQLLRPLHHYCGAQTDRFYVIDEQGRAYKCICDVDKPDARALFNICDDEEDRVVNWQMETYYMTGNPVKSAPCRTCKVLPLCNGYCRIDRDPERYWVPVRCHPIKTVIEDYVRDYYRALTEEV